MRHGRLRHAVHAGRARAHAPFRMALTDLGHGRRRQSPGCGRKMSIPPVTSFHFQPRRDRVHGRRSDPVGSRGPAAAVRCIRREADARRPPSASPRPGVRRRHAALAAGIGDVLVLRAEKQMVRTDTRRVVAAMEDTEPVRNGPGGQLPRQSMGEAPLPDPALPVPLPGPRGLPFPATIPIIPSAYMRPEFPALPFRDHDHGVSYFEPRCIILSTRTRRRSSRAICLQLQRDPGPAHTGFRRARS